MDVHALKVIEVLAEHDAVRTCLCEDPASGARVVLRTLSLKAARSHEEVELFARETAVLEHIDHPRLPRILGHARETSGDDVRLHQVRRFVEGQTLFEELRSGRHLTEREALTTVLGVAETLATLHDRSPALVHRDIKPHNLVRTEAGAAHAESVTVIDLGAIKAGPATGRTIVGTYGYMPPEQFEGRSTPASDVFALGMTLIFLLTHKEPGDFGDGGARAHFRADANVSKPTAELIDAMIAYDPAARPASGREVAARLRAILSPTEASASSSAHAGSTSRSTGGAPANTGAPRKAAGLVALLALLLLVPAAVGVYLVLPSAPDVGDVRVPLDPPVHDPVDLPPARRPEQTPSKASPFLGLSEAERGLVECSARLFPRLVQSERRYLSWVGPQGPTGKERIVYGLYRGYDDAIGRCETETDLAAFARRALAVVAEAEGYYEEEDYRDDGFARGRALHPQLLAIFKELHGLRDDAHGRIEQALAGLDPASDDPPAATTRALMKRAWSLAFASPAKPLKQTAWVNEVRQLEDTFAQSVERLSDGSEEDHEVKELADRLERYRQRLKRTLRDATKRSSRRDPEQLREDLRSETLRLLQGLAQEDHRMVLFKRR